MPFSGEDKALVKNLYQFKGYSSWNFVMTLALLDLYCTLGFMSYCSLLRCVNIVNGRHSNSDWLHKLLYSVIYSLADKGPREKLRIYPKIQ